MWSWLSNDRKEVVLMLFFVEYEVKYDGDMIDKIIEIIDEKN